MPNFVVVNEDAVPVGSLPRSAPGRQPLARVRPKGGARRRRALWLFAVVTLIPLRAGAQRVSGATVSPTTALSLPSGSTVYLYGMVTGGGATSTVLEEGPYQSVTDASGYVGAALAFSASDANRFATDSGYYAIGGIGVSGFNSMEEFSGSNPQSGAAGASVEFTVSADSLVVIIATASSQQSIALSGVPGLQVDASTGYPDAITIAHASLGPGSYTASETSAALASGQADQNMADLIGVFVFSAASSPPEAVNLGAACVDGQRVDINGVATPGPDVSAIAWNWGDGNTATGYFPESHVYASPGQYTVEATASYLDGSKAVASEAVTVGSGILAHCNAVTISAGRGGSVSYQASVGSAVVAPGGSATLQVDGGDDLTVNAEASLGNVFTAWTASGGASAIGGGTFPVSATTAQVVVAGTSAISAGFTMATGAAAAPGTVSLSVNPVTISESSPTPPSVVATIFDQNDDTMAGQPVTFTSSAGTLSSATATTDSLGQAAVTLSIGEVTSSPVTVTVTAAAGGVTQTAEVTFVPPTANLGDWQSSSAFSVSSAGLPLGNYLSPALLCVFCNTDISALPTARLYLVLPARGISGAQFAQALSEYFGITMCADPSTDAVASGCIGAGGPNTSPYSPAAVLILDLPVVQTLNALFPGANLSAPLSVDLNQLFGLNLPEPNLTTTTSGDLNLAFTFGSASSANLTSAALNAIAASLSVVVKPSPDELAGAFGSDLGTLLGLGDISLTVVQDNLDQTGALSGHTLIDVAGLASDLGVNTATAANTELSLSGYAGKIITLAGATGDFFNTSLAAAIAGGTTGAGAAIAAADFLPLARMVLTTIDIVVEAQQSLAQAGVLPQAGPLLSDFETGVEVVTSFVDPPGVRIMPTFYTEAGALALGYDPVSGSMTYSGPLGFLLPTGDGYLALLTADPSAPPTYREVLTALGADTPMPYSVQVRSYNRAQAIQTYNGLLTGGTSASIEVGFNPTSGALLPQVSLTPAVNTVQTAGGITVTAEPLLSDGSSGEATDAYLLVNGQELPMAATGSSAFATTLSASGITGPTPFMLYMISPGVPGGFASGVLGCGVGTHLVTTLRSLTLDASTGQYVAVLSVSNDGGTTAGEVTFAASALNGVLATSSLPINVGNLGCEASAQVTLTFPASAGQPGGGGLLVIHETYSGGTAGGAFRVVLP